MAMDMHEKMWACKHHREGYLEDTCLYEDETYSFDDPDNAFYLWLECKKCKHFEPKTGKKVKNGQQDHRCR